MKANKTLLAAASSVLAASMAHGAIVYQSVNQTVATSDSGYDFDLNTDGTTDFKVFFDANNATKPCVLGTDVTSVPTPYVLNELVMTPDNPDNNGVPVIPFGTTITSQFDVDTNTVAVGYTDQQNKNEGYLYQNGENNTVGQWPAGQDTFGYVALALVDNSVDPATTNYGWVHLELNYTLALPTVTVIDYAYEDTANTDIQAGQEGPIAIPAIYQTPTNQTVAAGTTVTMSVAAMGNPDPAYQWMAGTVGSGIYTNLTNAGDFSGVNTSTLVISNATPAYQLDYAVSVSNDNGAVTSSPPATLTVIAVRLAGPVPDQQVIYAGYPASFTVTDIGGVTTTNWWLRNNVGLSDGGGFSGTTTTNLLISSVDPTNLGGYKAVASTVYGSVTSSVAPLGIAYPDGSLYEATVRSLGAAHYYRLNETSGTNAWDFIGGKNGSYGTSAVLGQPGPTPDTAFPGFASTNYAATFQFLDPNDLLPVAPWNLNTNTVTFTAWIYPQFNEGNGGIVFTAGTNNMVCGIRYDGGYLNENGLDGNIGYSWGNDFGIQTWNSGITAPHDEWSLVALAVSPTDATLYIINNEGVQSAVNTAIHPVQAFDATEYIGTYPLEGALGNNNFNGQIDEVAIFTSTLSSNQVYALYASGLNQMVNQPPSPITLTVVGGNIQLEWTGGTLLQSPNPSGPWDPVPDATSPYSVSPTNSRLFFRTQQ